MVGHRLRIYWPLDDAYYKGTITGYTHTSVSNRSLLLHVFGGACGLWFVCPFGSTNCAQRPSQTLCALYCHVLLQGKTWHGPMSPPPIPVSDARMVARTLHVVLHVPQQTAHCTACCTAHRTACTTAHTTAAGKAVPHGV